MSGDDKYGHSSFFYRTIVENLSIPVYFGGGLGYFLRIWGEILPLDGNFLPRLNYLLITYFVYCGKLIELW